MSQYSSVNEVLGQTQLEIDCLNDVIVRLSRRLDTIESFIKTKHGQLALDELPLFLPSDEQAKDNNNCDIVTEFSDIFIQGPPPSSSSNTTDNTNSIVVQTQPRQFVITPSKIHKDTSKVKQSIVPNLETTPTAVEEENRPEIPVPEPVPDAIREETVGQDSTTNINLINVYEAEDIAEDIEFINNEDGDGGDYSGVVAYDVIPTIVFEDKSVTSSSLPSNKHAGTIRMYKPELKSFTRVPAESELSGVVVAQAENANFICSVCRKGFETKDVLDRHMLMHSVVRYTCDECGRDFNNGHNLNLHKGKHDRLRSKKQTEAAKKVVFRQRVQDDVENRKFKCSKCDLRYVTASKRNLHEKTHTNEKPFICEICGLAFKNRAGLADHTIGHKGQRSHLCHICPAGFLRSRNLLKHIRFVHSLVQIKTVVDGKRIVEFVSPEEAVILVEERKNNVENKESKRSRLRKLDTTDEPESKKKRGRPKKYQKSDSEEEDDEDLISGSSEDEPIDEAIVQHIKLEPEEGTDSLNT